MLILALQLALPFRTPMPADSYLVPRNARPLIETPLPTYTALLQNPLFAPDRSPGGTSVAGGAGPGSLDQLTVTGIAIARGRVSAVVAAGDGKTMVLHPGQEIAGWRLAGADAAHLVFIRGSERRILTLDPHKAAASGQAAQSQDDDEDEQR